MARQIVQIAQPALGLDRAWAIQSGPDFTLCEGNNVRGRDCFESRARLGSRPGLVKAFPQQLGLELLTESFTKIFYPTKDTSLEGYAPRQAITNGSSTSVEFGNDSGALLNNMHCLFHFDMSTIPAGATISTAPFSFYVAGGPLGGAWAGRIHRMEDVEEGWVESQASWDNKATATPWTGAEGASYTLTTPVGIDFLAPTTIGWQTVADLGTLAQYAYTNRSKQLHILCKRSDETVGTTQRFLVRSKDYSDPAFRPYISVTYEVPV